MPEQYIGSQTSYFHSGPRAPAEAEGDAETLRIARRMHQLASEIRAAYQCSDMTLARHASALLAPTLAQWRTAPPISEPDVQRETARLADEARRLLDETAEALTQHMGRITGEIQRLRKSRQMLARIRQRRAPSAARRLDIKY